MLATLIFPLVGFVEHNTTGQIKRNQIIIFMFSNKIYLGLSLLLSHHSQCCIGPNPAVHHETTTLCDWLFQYLAWFDCDI